jgi:hypothetical protein
MDFFPFDGSWEWKDDHGIPIRVSREVAAQLLVEAIPTNRGNENQES